MGWPSDTTTSRPPSPPSGPMTSARTKALHDKVNSLLCSYEFDAPLDGLLPHASTLCILSYEPQGLHQDHPLGHQGTGARREEEEKDKSPKESAPAPVKPASQPIQIGQPTPKPDLGPTPSVEHRFPPPIYKKSITEAYRLSVRFQPA